MGTITTDTAPRGGVRLTDGGPALAFLFAIGLPAIASLPMQAMLVLRLTGLDLTLAGVRRGPIDLWISSAPDWKLAATMLALGLGSTLLGLALAMVAVRSDGKPRPLPYPHAWWLAYVAASSAFVALATLLMVPASGTGPSWASAAALNLLSAVGAAVAAGTLAGRRASLLAKSAESRYRSDWGLPPAGWSE